MKFYLVLALAALLPAFSQATAADQPSTDPVATAIPTEADSSNEDESADANVNSRYTVESVGVLSPQHYRLSWSLVEEMRHLVGVRFNDQIFKDLAQRISNELHGYQVAFKLARGSDPDHVRVNFDVHGPKFGFDVEFPKLVYTNREGPSGESDAVLNVGNNAFTLGVVSDRDSMLERSSGFRARYDRWNVGSDRVHLSLEFASYREQYDSATQTAAVQANDLSSLYRVRRSVDPTATIVLAGPLTWTVGLSFTQFSGSPAPGLPDSMTPGSSTPSSPAARTEAANAFVNSLRYDGHWQDSVSGTHRFSAGYSLRAATNFLGGAYAYTRHLIDATYHWKRGHQQSQITFQAGAINGQAPLFDRFVLGTSANLRGWDKYEIDPLGGSRILYGSVGYGYRLMRVFYDTGAVWDRTKHAAAKHSAGIGIKVEGILFAVAFPMRGDHMEPVFIAGMNF
jgi:hypothetical protein